MPGHVKGVLFADYVRMLRAHRGRTLDEFLEGEQRLNAAFGQIQQLVQPWARERRLASGQAGRDSWSRPA